MTITDRDSVCRLLRENSHELLKWFSWLAYIKPKRMIEQHLLNFDAITVNEITCEWRIMIRIEPIPADTSFVVVGINPL